MCMLPGAGKLYPYRSFITLCVDNWSRYIAGNFSHVYYPLGGTLVVSFNHGNPAYLQC